MILKSPAIRGVLLYTFCLGHSVLAQELPLLHPLFADHMVMQRDKKIAIWGWAQPGVEVKASMAGQSATATAEQSGRWEAELGPFPAGGPHALQIDGPTSITRSDVLVGDVWICSGQSNMEWPVRLSNDAEQEIAGADHPKIRLFTVPKRISTMPQSSLEGSWSACTPESIANFSAVAYYFGRHLQRELDVPIGLIHTSWGGTLAEAWTSGEALRAMPDFEDPVARFQRTAEEVAAGKLDVPEQDAQFGKNPNAVTVLYNGMLAPLVPYAIKGAIWYQGESNAGKPMQYRRLLPTMIADWRKRFGQGDFPFLVVQLANFMQQQTEPVQSGWADLRKAQLLTSRDPNVGLAVTTDIGEANDIHPRNKQDVGKRLALSALRIAYQRDDVVHSGPTVKTMEVIGDSLRVVFDNVGSGLEVRGDKLLGFAIADPDGDRFLWADAKLDGNDAVIVSNEELLEPIKVRYNWANNPVGNLFNKEGLPAGPFRTDVPPTTEPVSARASTELPLVKAEDAGMSGEKLALVKPALQKFVDEQKVSGAIVIAARHGKVVLFESVGYRDLESKLPMEKDTILRFYSMTKAVTSVAAMLLVEEGKLDLDGAVGEYIPELKDLQVFTGASNGTLEVEDAKRPMTIRDLLRHTSGLTYGFFGDTPIDRAYQSQGVMGGDLQNMMRKLAEVPLLYQPGTRFNYSVSTDVLGHVIERVSGTRLDKFFQQRVLQPLDMRDTGFHVPKDKVSRFANNYGPRETGQGLRVIDDAANSRYLQPPEMYSGGGGFVSTARDYMRFCQMLLNKGELHGLRLLEADTVEQMTRNQMPDEAFPIVLNGRRDGVGFGLGFSVVVERTPYTKAAAIGEYGWGGAASTHFWMSPADDLAVIVLTQYMPFSFQLEDAVKPFVYDAISD